MLIVLISASPVARITGVSYGTQLFIFSFIYVRKDLALLPKLALNS
jgi:hypothetical protein